MSEEIFQTMNTVAQTKAEGGDEQGALRSAKKAILEVEKKFSYFDPLSELSKINKILEKRKSAPVSAELYEILLVAQEIKKVSHGLFDVTYLSDQKQNTMHFVNHNTVVFKSNSPKINLGAIAKGYAADLALENAKEFCPKRILISIGGHINCFSRDAPWRIGLQNPNQDFGQLIGTLAIKEGSFSTSAQNYRGHHIINPINRNQQSGHLSVSVLHPRGIFSDSLSTALFLDSGNRLANICQKYNLGIIIIKKSKVQISKHLLSDFLLENLSFSLETLSY